MTNPVIILTPKQMLLGAQVGIMRQVENVEKKRKERHGASTKNDWQMHIEGCLGEMAAAKWLDMFWDGKLGDLSSGDVGKVEVRTTSEKKNRLRLHPSDKDHLQFIHVVGLNGVYELMGWLYARDGKIEPYWQDPTRGSRPAFFVDNNHLEPMSTFWDSWNE